MNGIVLAAGRAQRLGETTLNLPKTLLPVDGPKTILDIALRNLAAAGIADVVVVTGHAAAMIDDRVPALQDAHGVKIETLYNERYLELNNCHSLWLARDAFAAGALLVNGDTVHPGSVERALLDGNGSIRIAVDDRKNLDQEEMKVHVEGERLRRINKGLDPSEAQGEYIGLTLIEATVARDLAGALEETWRRDPSLYYEDGYQTYVDGGGEVRVVPIGTVEWVEVDTHDDLARAREIACRY